MPLLPTGLAVSILDNKSWSIEIQWYSRACRRQHLPAPLRDFAGASGPPPASRRAFHRALKLARTIAGLAGSDAIQPAHLAEAMQYRPARQGDSGQRRSLLGKGSREEENNMRGLTLRGPKVIIAALVVSATIACAGLNPAPVARPITPAPTAIVIAATTPTAALAPSAPRQSIGRQA